MNSATPTKRIPTMTDLQISISIGESKYGNAQPRVDFFWSTPISNNAAMAKVYSTLAKICGAAGRTQLMPHVGGLMNQGRGCSSCQITFETMDGTLFEAKAIDAILHDAILAPR